jgi:hypothetical protein
VRKLCIAGIIAICLILWEVFERTVLDCYLPASSMKFFILRVIIAGVLGWLLGEIIYRWVSKKINSGSNHKGDNGPDIKDR